VKILILLVALLPACTHHEKESETTTKPQPSPVTKVSADEFISSPFGFEDKLENYLHRLGVRFSVAESLVESPHQTGVFNRFYNLTFKNSKLIIFERAYNLRQWLISAEINDSEIKLDCNVQIGMSKNVFENTFFVIKHLSGDLLELSDHEQVNRAQFQFQDGKLSSISLEYYLD